MRQRSGFKIPFATRPKNSALRWTCCGCAYGAPLAIPRKPRARIDAGHIFLMINRGDEWQLGFVIPKGTTEQVRERGMAAFRETITRLAPFLRDRVSELRDWNDVRSPTTSSPLPSGAEGAEPPSTVSKRAAGKTLTNTRAVGVLTLADPPRRLRKTRVQRVALGPGAYARR
jgi:hypothetical protein